MTRFTRDRYNGEMDEVPADDEYVRSLTCAWFLWCENSAVALVPHPVLGPVPTCQRCLPLARGG